MARFPGIRQFGVFGRRIMQIRILGCSGGVGGELRTTSLLVDDDILIDAGTGVGEMTLDEMAGIRHIFPDASPSGSHRRHSADGGQIFDRIDEPIIIHARRRRSKRCGTHFQLGDLAGFHAIAHCGVGPVLRYELLDAGRDAVRWGAANTQDAGAIISFRASVTVSSPRRTCRWRLQRRYHDQR